MSTVRVRGGWRRAADTGVETLRAAFPWPEEMPDTPPLDEGWLHAGTRRLLDRSVSRRTRVILELGSWVGKSARHLARRAPRATVVCIDHWDLDRTRLTLSATPRPDLYETFLVNCWALRDRIVPIRRDSVDGMRIVHAYGVRPDLVYVDAAHDYDSVLADVETALELFPDAVLVGDDLSYEGVRRAIAELRLPVTTTDTGWRHVPQGRARCLVTAVRRP